MGAGTGDLPTAGHMYQVVLTFDTGRISQTDPIFTNFESALIWLINGLKYVGAGGSYTVQAAAGQVTGIKLEVTGPLTGDDTKGFNRALNRLLWGVRHRRSPHDPPPLGPNPPYQYPSNRYVTLVDPCYTADEET